MFKITVSIEETSRQSSLYFISKFIVRTMLHYCKPLPGAQGPVGFLYVDINIVMYCLCETLKLEMIF